MPEGSQSVCVLGQLPLLKGLQYKVDVQDVGKALHESLDQALISASHQLPDHSSCNLAKMHMASVCLRELQGIMLQGWRSAVSWRWCRWWCCDVAELWSATVTRRSGRGCGHVREQGVMQEKFLGHCLLEVGDHVIVGMPGRGIPVGGRGLCGGRSGPDEW